MRTSQGPLGTPNYRRCSRAGASATMRSALIKVSSTLQRIPCKDPRSTQAMSAFFIIPPTTNNALDEQFQTHPTVTHRLARLEAMERAMNVVPR